MKNVKNVKKRENVKKMCRKNRTAGAAVKNAGVQTCHIGRSPLKKVEKVTSLLVCL